MDADSFVFVVISCRHSKVYQMISKSTVEEGKFETRQKRLQVEKDLMTGKKVIPRLIFPNLLFIW